MKRFVAVASVIVAFSAPVAVNANVQTATVRQAHCQTEEVIYPDGSGDSVRICHTTSDGVR